MSRGLCPVTALIIRSTTQSFWQMTVNSRLVSDRWRLEMTAAGADAILTNSLSVSLCADVRRAPVLRALVRSHPQLLNLRHLPTANENNDAHLRTSNLIFRAPSSGLVLYLKNSLFLRCYSRYGDCLEDKRKDYQNCSVLYCAPYTQLYAHSYEQFLQVN